MKKLLTTLTLFMALALTACGGANASSGDKSSSVPAHVHTFDTTKWESDASQHWHPATCEHTAQKGDKANHDFKEVAAESVAASCSAEGKKVEACSICGYKKETKIDKLAHTYQEVTAERVEPTCSVPGKKVEVCSVCGDRKETPLTAEHDFSIDVPHDQGEGEVNETIKKCSRDNTHQILWSAQDANKTVSGSFNNKGKLGSQNDSVSYKFYSPFAMKVRLWVKGIARYNEWWDRANPDNSSQAVWFNYKEETNGNNWKYDIFVNGTDDANKIDQDAAKVVVSAGEVSVKELSFLDLDINTEGLNESSNTEISDIMMPWVEFDVLEGANTIKIARTSGYTNYFTNFILIGSPAA